MKILFVMDRRANRGSIQAVSSYSRAGQEAGHTIALFGRRDPCYPGIPCSTDMGSFDRLVFICEFGIEWISGLRQLRILAETTREQRVVLDADGMYNRVILVDGYDRNHRNEWERSQWVGLCDQLAGRIMQPTQQPLEPSVLAVPFYGYDSGLQMPAAMRQAKRYDLMHVGHNWWRWREVSGVLLPAIERIRDRLGSTSFVGLWWDSIPGGVEERDLAIAFGYDSDWFLRLGIEARPPVSFDSVVRVMSESRINIMTQRPLFRRLRLLTSKFFEIFCADTIPAVMLDPDHAESVYGPAGRELALYPDVAGKLRDMIAHTARFNEIVHEVRKHLAEHHSFQRRVQQLVHALEQRLPT